MANIKISPTGIERTFAEDEFIVSKTDLKGRITYVNEVFCKVARYSEQDALGKPHSLVRHPDMPRCVFKLLWDTIEAGNEIFAYVVNLASDGAHYWVFAHVTPTFDNHGNIIGYHSNRRKPRQEAVNAVSGLYRTLIEIENKHSDRKEGMNAALNTVVNLLKDKGTTYEEFVLTL
jgi:PAS domain S-box-containing protein